MTKPLTKGQFRVLVRVALGLPFSRRPDHRCINALEGWVLSSRPKEPALIRKNRETYRMEVTDAGLEILNGAGSRSEREAIGTLRWAPPDYPSLTPWAKTWIERQVHLGHWRLETRADGSKYIIETEAGRQHWDALWGK